MGKPRLLILIRHAQSEGNKNREIHQSVPDHRVKLTPEGQKQAQEAGHRLRAMLRPDDKLHFFTSPYRRTRETTEGILSTLTSDNPSPSPFPRNQIKVYEEPRLREQDFGNFQPCSAAMERMWQERADYGHFFYRIPNGESAADAYDRVSGFNESLWRLFGEDDFASVCVLVTHGLMTRIFLMKWYHFSVEYFEDLRNVNHCEFVVMKKGADNGKYVLQNQLRTWSELEKEQEREWAEKHGQKAIEGVKNNAPLSPPIRRKWGGCPDGCNHRLVKDGRKKPVRKNTADLYRDDEDAVDAGSPGSRYEEKKTVEIKKHVSSSHHHHHQHHNHHSSSSTVKLATTGSSDFSPSPPRKGSGTHEPITATATTQTTTATSSHPHSEEIPHQRLSSLRTDLGGRDGGGSESGKTSRVCSDEEGDHQEVGEEQKHRCHKHHGMANVLGDGDDDDGEEEYTQEDEDEDGDADAKERLRAEKEEDQSLRGSVY
ncbi:hypothetical protein FQN54_008464 [Arachnomyces sp. PD_36]|nr:hypothetical protein FQN54_008464 [Arachnomyces sp. PD_36]